MPITHLSASTPRRSNAIFISTIVLFTLALIFSGHFQIAFFVGLMAFLVLGLTAYLSIYSFIPELTIDQMTRLIWNPSNWGNGIEKNCFRILDGKFPDQPEILQQHQSLWILQIDPSSLVVIHHPSFGCQLLFPGIHIINKSAAICAVFSLAPQKVVFGPESEMMLYGKKGGEGLADYHVRFNKARITASTSGDGQGLLPRFEVYYRIDFENHEPEILKQANRFLGQLNQITPVLFNKFLEDQLQKLIMDEWNAKIMGKLSSEIISETPYQLFQEEQSRFGLVFKVYVCAVYKE
jgi:hypothetical protein